MGLSKWNGDEESELCEWGADLVSARSIIQCGSFQNSESKAFQASSFGCEKVVDCLLRLLDTEVKVHLRGIAKRLMDSKTEITWSVMPNNCQRLVSVLMSGKDFEYTFPRLPKHFGSRDRDTEGRYF